MNICVVGVGYVGLITGTCFAEYGTNVVCVDNDPEKIKMLQNDQIPIYEPGLTELFLKNKRAGRLQFSTDLESAVKKSLVIFIAVGTPRGLQGEANLEYVFDVARGIGTAMESYKVIVTKSTVPTGTGKEIKRLIKDHQPVPHPLDVVSNPEFLREGSAIEDSMRPNRVVIGVESEQAVAIMKDLYAPLFLIEAPMVITSVETAEMIKYASNAFLATKVSFINEIANICEGVGADVHVVAKGMGLDGRIGSKFLHPGPGFGGSCFPKDTRAVVELAEKCGYDFKLVKSVIEVNNQQSVLMVEKIEKGLDDLSSKRIAVLGLTFKPNTDDVRESPAIAVIKGMQSKGAIIVAHDPVGMEQAKKTLSHVEFSENPYDAAIEADAVVLATEWNDFRNLDWELMKKNLKAPVVFDLRNIYEPEKMARLGFTYYCVGRPYVPPLA
jgi:UDPglucose 6-dehydrogenase